MKTFEEIKSIKQLHQLLGYENPKHPLVSVVDFSKVNPIADIYQSSFILNLYFIGIKEVPLQGFQYGRNQYDFEEGTMMFMAPGQVFSIQKPTAETEYKGYGIFFHSDLIVSCPLGAKIENFGFFSYNVSEALHLSDDEKKIILSIVENIQKEYYGSIDRYSQDVIVTGIEQLLNYSQRFYGRQFITRKKLNNDLISRFEQLVSDYFSSYEYNGLPDVAYFADKMYLSSGYLTDLLKKETGKTTKEYIQIHIVEFAKKRLLNSNSTVSEIAYALGFEYPQYFSRLFKQKTGMTPLEYRRIN
ncbi:transcriptional regulator [Arachidicoccus ginsenosidimutans]|uniref:helix-turn-helix domain-containing protein n=1 Tax=Arachidicoccus sp. BS20 TaxID=1850526 RepID=UPI0007F0A566|nr:helix-turn-helix domain-containing protein [Arachidicoccus sp. BS20]ANI88103.1 transcriptional regulator [Arachidicoccus sp. BS20]